MTEALTVNARSWTGRMVPLHGAPTPVAGLFNGHEMQLIRVTHLTRICHLQESAKGVRKFYLARSPALHLEQPLGLLIKTATHRARETATLSRLRLYRNSIPLGESSGVDVAIE